MTEGLISSGVARWFRKIRASECLAVVNHQMLCHKASTLGHTGCFSTVLNKSTDMRPWLCFLTRLSLSRAVTAAPLVHERSYSLQQGLGGSGTVSSEQSSGSTMGELCCYINIYSSLSAIPPPHPPNPALFCCFNHSHHGPISSRKSRALHLLCAVTSGFNDLHWLCNLCTITLISGLHGKSSGVDQVSNPRLYSEQCILSLYFDLAICTASGCLRWHLFSRLGEWMCCTTTLSWKPSPLLEMKMIYINGMRYCAKKCFPNILYHEFACEQIQLYSQFAYNLLGMTPVVDDTELTVCSNCVT